MKKNVHVAPSFAVTVTDFDVTLRAVRLKRKTEFNSYLTWLWKPETHLDAFKTIYNCGWLIVFSSFLDFRFFFLAFFPWKLLKDVNILNESH